MKITIKNSYHNTETNIVVKSLPATLTPAQVRRCRETLCGCSGCTCGGELGERGEQDVDIAFGRNADQIILAEK